MNKNKKKKRTKQRTVKDLPLKGKIPREKIRKAVDEVMDLEKDSKKIKQLQKQFHKTPKTVSNTLRAIKKIRSEKFEHYREDVLQKLGYFATLKTKIARIKTKTIDTEIISNFAEESLNLITVLNRSGGSQRQLSEALITHLDKQKKIINTNFAHFKIACRGVLFTVRR